MLELITKLKTFEYSVKTSDNLHREMQLVKELASLVPRNALMLIEQKVPKQFQEDLTYKVLSFRKGFYEKC